MAATTKITLSAKELSLVTNAEWILTKQQIIQKVYLLFSAQIPVIKSVLTTPGLVLPEEAISSVPKIYKGENYLQLPYVMLDYPRCFSGKDIFAIRTMFWWGNFFSITLHIAGKYKEILGEKIRSNEQLASGRLYIGVNEDQWQHHFEENNFLPLCDLSKEEQLSFLGENDFIKLALKFPLQEWNDMPAMLQEGYHEIAAILS